MNKHPRQPSSGLRPPSTAPVSEGQVPVAMATPASVGLSSTLLLPTPANPLPMCLTRQQVAELLQFSVSTVDRMAANGELQRIKTLGRAVRFRKEDVENYLQGKNRRARSDAPYLNKT